MVETITTVVQTILLDVHPGKGQRAHPLLLESVLMIDEDGGQVLVWVVGYAH